MKIDVSKNAGFCYGVKRALNIVDKAIKDDSVPKPIYIYGPIIHNKKVVSELSNKGVITLERDPSLFSKIKGTIIFSAHGISKELIDLAKKQGLQVIDASCTDVLKTFKLIENSSKKVLYLGVKNHPEALAALSYPNVRLIETCEDLKEIKEEAILVSQTTLSLLEIKDILDLAHTMPNVEIKDILCHTTTLRQTELLAAKDYDLVYVVGDKLSNNTNSLARLVSNAKLIEDYHDIDLKDLEKVNKIFITAGASTPDYLITEVVDYLKEVSKSTCNFQTNKL